MNRKEQKLIMILEDDEDLAEGIALSLQGEELNFEICRTISEARDVLKKKEFDLLIFDINLPDGSGLELCREVRHMVKVPIALLTAKDMELDIVTGLESGADDYITKPFSLTEQKILYLLVSNPNRILTRERLLDWVWSDGAEYVEDNALSVGIRRLRDKLEDDPSNPALIKTVYGKGYLWESL